MGVLGREEISERLFTGDVERQLFKPGSWDLAQVRGAAYDLRVSSTFLILPDGQRFWPQAPEPINRAWLAELTLSPGEVAFVSTVERFCMPWDLAGNIAPKFRFALEGLFVMGGMLVDPGYGRAEADRPGHEGDDGERLHFQLANLGAKEISIAPEETSIAAIQFLGLDGDSRWLGGNVTGGERVNLDVPTSDKLLRRLFHAHASEPLPQLHFFSNATQVEENVSELDTRVRGNVDHLDRRIQTQEIQAAASEVAIDRIIIFGIFLVLITILGVALSAAFG